MKKFHSVLSVFLSVVLVALFCVNSVPAYASDTISEFDFSAADTLDTYDSYRYGNGSGDSTKKNRKE